MFLLPAVLIASLTGVHVEPVRFPVVLGLTALAVIAGGRAAVAPDPVGHDAVARRDDNAGDEEDQEQESDKVGLQFREKKSIKNY